MTEKEGRDRNTESYRQKDKEGKGGRERDRNWDRETEIARDTERGWE